jgi:hypothetical protein
MTIPMTIPRKRPQNLPLCTKNGPKRIVDCLSGRIFGWPRLLRRSSSPEPCLPRTALTARVSRSTDLLAVLLGLLHAILALAPDALVLADAAPAAVLALAPPALVLAKGRPSAILALVPLPLVLADAAPAAVLTPAPDAYLRLETVEFV